MKSPHTMPLSPVDAVFYGKDSYPVEFLFHFDYPVDAGRLRRALERAISRFWPVGARIVPDPRWSYVFQRGDWPVDLVELPAVPEVPDLASPRALAPFSRPVHTLPGEPLAKFQIARAGTGTLFVASISHSVVDGYSYFFFLTALAEALRNNPLSRDFWKHRLLARPLHDRNRLRPAELDVRPLVGELDPEVFFRRTGLAVAGERNLPPLEESKWEILRFPADELAKAMAEAKAHANVKLSAHDLITAQLWKRAAREWHSSNEPLDCSSAFDYRRVLPELTARYFGNAVRATTLRLDRDEVVALPLGALAAKIRTATLAVDRTAAIDSLRAFEEVRLARGPEAFRNMHVSHPERGLLVTNMSRIPLAAIDFGSGGPKRAVALTSAPRAALIITVGGELVVRLSPPA